MEESVSVYKYSRTPEAIRFSGATVKGSVRPICGVMAIELGSSGKAESTPIFQATVPVSELHIT